MSPPRLLAISPGDHGVRRDLVAWASALAAAGLTHLLVREKHLTAEAYRDLVARLGPIVPWVLGHGDCAAVEASGVHLAAGGDPVGRAPLVGVSCHTAGEVDAALSAGADYVTLSPVWAPASKADDRPTLGPSRFLAIAAGRPVLALGGVTAARYHRLVDGGATGAAVCGALFGTVDPAGAARRLRAFQNR